MKNLAGALKKAVELFSRLNTKEKAKKGINTVIEYLGPEKGGMALRLEFKYAALHDSKCKEFMQQYLSRREGGL